ncbi:Uncharacterised protein [Mobiluncus curtisii]|uniref:Uncharacterized protein n=1 Tax=Mobiluncus curtisii TaxID=2051 RepID=A0A2X3DS34_9ACTO|nr:Uncharacterised protein [Mobiluncus curtisii]
MDCSVYADCWVDNNARPRVFPGANPPFRFHSRLGASQLRFVSRCPHRGGVIAGDGRCRSCVGLYRYHVHRGFRGAARKLSGVDFNFRFRLAVAGAVSSRTCPQGDSVAHPDYIRGWFSAAGIRFLALPAQWSQARFAGVAQFHHESQERRRRCKSGVWVEGCCCSRAAAGARDPRGDFVPQRESPAAFGADIPDSRWFSSSHVCRYGLSVVYGCRIPLDPLGYGDSRTGQPGFIAGCFAGQAWVVGHPGHVSVRGGMLDKCLHLYLQRLHFAR